MRVLVATDGSLEPRGAADTAVRLAGPDGDITLFTAVEVPRHLLDLLRSAYEQVSAGPAVDADAEYVTAVPAGAVLSSSWPGDDALLERVVTEEAERRLGPLRQALEEKGIEPVVKGVESEDPATAIVTELIEGEHGVLCIGSHGQGRFEGLLGSTGTKLVRQSPVSVVVLKPQAESASR